MTQNMWDIGGQRAKAGLTSIREDLLTVWSPLRSQVQIYSNENFPLNAFLTLCGGGDVMEEDVLLELRIQFSGGDLRVMSEISSETLARSEWGPGAGAALSISAGDERKSEWVQTQVDQHIQFCKSKKPLLVDWLQESVWTRDGAIG